MTLADVSKLITLAVAPLTVRLIKTDPINSPFKDIANALPDIVVIFNTAFEVEYLNGAALSFFEVNSVDDFIKSPLSLVGNITTNALVEAIETGYWTGENVLTNQQGVQMPVLQTVIAHKTTADRFYFSSIYKNIGYLKSLENNLENKVEELNTLMYRLSHDLRSPLTSIKGILGLMKFEKANDNPKDLVPLIEQQCNALVTILDGFSFLVEMNERTLSIISVDVQAVINKALHSFGENSNFNRIKIEIDVNDGLHVLSSQNLLYVIISNLIENAVQFIDHQKESMIKVLAYYDTQQLTIVVKDNGVGFDTQLESKVFDLFFRAHESLSGAGIGLYLTKSAVHRLGGRISVKTNRGKGSIFSVHIPCDLIKN